MQSYIARFNPILLFHPHIFACMHVCMRIHVPICCDFSSFLASQDALEVMRVTDWLTESWWSDLTDMTLVNDDTGDPDEEDEEDEEDEDCDVSPVAMFSVYKGSTHLTS